MNIKITTASAGQGIVLSYPNGRYAPVTHYSDSNCIISLSGLSDGWQIEPASESDIIISVTHEVID